MFTEQREDTERHECVDGWQGEDHMDRPIPCPVCKPHLAAQRRALQKRLGLAA